MKKLVGILLSAVVMLTACIPVFAESKTKEYTQVFERGTLDCREYRIPALLTLNDGSVIAAADMRYNHGKDSPNNIDTAVAISKDGYTDWNYNIINYFDDYADGETAKESASFIDSALGQSETGRIFIVTDAYPANGGVLNSEKGTGYEYIDNLFSCLKLKKSGDKDFGTYYAKEFDESGFAAIFDKSTLENTEFSIDREYNLYKNGEPLMQKQVGSDKEIQQNVFYENAEFTCVCTSYLWLRYSDDNGQTWSAPQILNPQVKYEEEGFLGVCPGRMTSVNYKGKTRIIFCVYTHSKTGAESVSTVYSDDNGVTWQREKAVSHTIATGKTSESQIVELNDGVLRMFCRNKGNYIATCDSIDGGETWKDKARQNEELPAQGNCMLSFINTSKEIDGKKVILGSYSGNQDKRADGVIKVGLVESDNTISWVGTYHFKNGFFAYSCLTELKDGNIGVLYEDEASHISYMVLTLDNNGNLSEVNGENPEFAEEKPNFFKNLWRNIITFLQKLFNVF